MDKQNMLYQGAEAVIVISEYMGKPIVQKKRLSKRYRIKEIDTRLISMRTKEEAKLIAFARNSGVAVPVIYDIDLVHGILSLEYLCGKRVKEILHSLSEDERKNICFHIGESIACLHNHDIIHGDITTSNMILLKDRIYFIDFGLGCITPEVELKGVDLHVLMQAFESTHSMYPDSFSFVVEGYKKTFSGNADEVISKIDEIVKRGRYR